MILTSTFKCFECGHIFESGEELRIVEPYGEEYLACPICGGAYEEAIECNNCENCFHENDLYNGLCAECVAKCMTADNMKQYLSDSSLEEDFYIEEYFKSSFTYVSPELLDIARCAFNKATFNSVLDEVQQRGELPHKYESPQTVMMREFILADHYGMYDFAEWINKKEGKK